MFLGKSELKNSHFIRATATLVGTMIGVGIFGIPFAFAKAGFLVAIAFFIVVTLATLLLYYLYGEVILRTDQQHQLVGYAGFYEGVWAKRIIFFTILLSTYAALLSYIIVAGEFWSNVLGPFYRITPETFSFVFFGIASLLVLSGIKTVSWVEVVLAGLFIFVIVSIFIFGAGQIKFANFTYTNAFYWFFPYGIFLFAFAGMPAVPIQRRILAGQEHLLKKSLITGTLFVALTYLIFGLTVFGITGDTTSPEAINGLVGFVSNNIIWLGSLFGGLAVSTSFLMLGTSMSEVFSLDYRLRKIPSWLLVIVPPAILFWGGMRNFIEVIGLAGAVAIGLESAMVIFIFRKARTAGDRVPEYQMKLPMWLLYIIALIFIGGAVYGFIF